jgi:glycosyltransferase involved in cell wall biosynthesis
VRILIVHEAIAGAGGVESYLAAVVPALIARGHALAYLHHHTRREEGPIRLEFPSVPSFSVGDDGLDAALASVSAWTPDVVFSHNMRHLDVDEALAARWPVVKMMHGYFGTCVSGQKSHAFPSVTVCTREFGPPCLALYLPRHCGQLRPGKMLEQYGWNSRQRALFERYASIVVASEYMRTEYVRHGVSAERALTAPLFPTTIAPGAPRVRPARPTVLFLGRMTALKGPRVVLEAAAAASKTLGQAVAVVMAGDGPEREALAQLAMSLGVEAAFPGWVSGAERDALLRTATVVAVPSLWPEPFGLVGLEAGAHGVPAVAFDVGGISEWLRDGVNGRLVRDPRGASAFGRTLADVLGDPALLATLERGALHVAGEMNLDAHLRRLEPALAAARRQSVAR